MDNNNDPNYIPDSSVNCNECDHQESHTFEEAIALAGYGIFHNLHLIIVGICLMAVICETMGVSFILIGAKCDLRLSLAEQGFVGSAGFLGIVLSSYFWGLLADTWGRQRTLRLAVTCSLVFSIISSVSLSVWMLIVSRFFVGCFISGCQACAYSYLGEFHGQGTRARAISFVTIFLPLGLLYIPATAIGILPLKIEYYIYEMKLSSWRIYALICSIPTLIAAITLPFLPESPKYLLAHEQHDHAMKTLQRIYTWNTRHPGAEYPVKYIPSEAQSSNFEHLTGFKRGFYLIWKQTSPLFSKKCVLNTGKILLLSFVIYGVAHGMFIWMPNMMDIVFTYQHPGMTMCEAIKTKREDDALLASHNITTSHECTSDMDPKAYLAVMVGGVVFILLYLLMGLIINKVGKKRLLVIWATTTGLCCIGLCWSNNLWLSVILMIIFLSLGNCGGILNAIAVEYYPTKCNAMAMCLILMLGRFGDIAGNNIIAAILSYDCNILLYTFGVATLLCALLAFFLPGRF